MKIVYVSELDIGGSGYSNITIQLCDGLAKLGHEVRAVCFSYLNQPHPWTFSVLPVSNTAEAVASVHNLVHIPGQRPDVIIVALDYPYQDRLLYEFKQRFSDIPYIAILPLESGPLSLSWAMSLMRAQKVFFMSRHATQAALEAGVAAEHLVLGMDTESWKLRTKEEYKEVRKRVLGIEDDTFVVFQVADNQERKNLPAAFQAVSYLRDLVNTPIKYVLVTRPKNQIGWDLQGLAFTYDISKEYIEFERGLSFAEMWRLYACADVFILTSKGEGYGFPLVEAMSVGVPVIGTDTGAITEHIEQGGGWLVDTEFDFCDPYGNARRGFIDVTQLVDKLYSVYSGLDLERAVQGAREYVESLDWQMTVFQINEAVEEVTHGKEKTQKPSLEAAIA